VVIPENFTRHLQPLNQHINDLLLPIASVPYIEYLVEFLLNSGVTEIIFVVKNFPESITEYIKTYMKDITKKNPKIFHIVTKENLTSVGDCLREVFKENLISSDFILIRGLTITSFSLDNAVKSHFTTKKTDKSCSITSVFKSFKNEYDNQTNYDKNLLIINKDTKQILQYESTDGSKKVKLNENIRFKLKPSELKDYEVKANVYDTFIDICSPEVLNHFSDNFDYHELRDDFYRNYLVSEMYLDTFYYYELNSKDYCNTVKNMESYLKMTYELINRWAHPVFSLDNMSLSQKLAIKYIYTHNNVYLGTGKESSNFTSNLNLARLSSISDFRTSSHGNSNESNSIQVSADYTTSIDRSVVGSHSVLSEKSVIVNSIIGRRSYIGKGSIIRNSVILDECDIGENVEIVNSVICAGTKVRSGVSAIRNSYLGSSLEIHPENERIELNGFKEKGVIENVRMFNEEDSMNNFLEKAKINENEDNLVDSEEEDINEEAFPYNITTHKDFFMNLDGWDLKMNCLRRNLDAKDEGSEMSKEDGEEEEEGEGKKPEEKDEFTESESENEQENEDFENPVNEIFEKRGEPEASTQELVILRKCYWDNTNGEFLRTYLTWILDDFFNGIDLEYDDLYYSLMMSSIQTWKVLLLRTMTNDEEDEINLLFVLEKIVEVRSHMEEAFSDIIRIFLDSDIVSKASVEKWKGLSEDKCGYSALIEEFVFVDQELHKKLVDSYDME